MPVVTAASEAELGGLVYGLLACLGNTANPHQKGGRKRERGKGGEGAWH